MEALHNFDKIVTVGFSDFGFGSLKKWGSTNIVSKGRFGFCIGNEAVSQEKRIRNISLIYYRADKTLSTLLLMHFGQSNSLFQQWGGKPVQIRSLSCAVMIVLCSCDAKWS